MITSTDFDSLPIQNKARLCCSQGRLLASRQTPDHFVHLYSVGTFLVELYYDNQHVHVQQVCWYSSYKLLGAYLDELPLPQANPARAGSFFSRIFTLKRVIPLQRLMRFAPEKSFA